MRRMVPRTREQLQDYANYLEDGIIDRDQAIER
jgi:hypothetical protein